MAKINKDEYKILKDLDERWWEWLAKDNDTLLWVYDRKPKKYGNCWDEFGGVCEIVDSDLFQFIQWEDSEPYNIQELIEEYEKKSEETEMKKDKKWLVDKWTKERNNIYVHDPAYQYTSEFIADVNLLDEPEVLSQEWIERNTSPVDDEGRLYVWKSDLQNAIVPKRDLPVIPQFVADWIEASRHAMYRLLGAVYDGAYSEDMKEWLFGGDKRVRQDNQDKLTRAWLDGYTVEEEQKYIVRFNRGTYKPVFIALDKISNHIHYVESHDYNKENLRVRLTEWEIRALDDGDVLFEHFAVKVEEIEEYGK